MGLWSKLFGEKPAPAKSQPLSGDELVARLQAGQPFKLSAALAGAEDDAEEQALWTLLPFTEGALRVEVIERLAGFEMDADKQARLLLAGVFRVPGISFTAPAIAEVCDLAALCRVQGELSEALRDASGRVVVALCEAVLGQGPADDGLEIEALAKLMSAWEETLDGQAAGPADVVALRLILAVFAALEDDPSAEQAGWTEAFEDRADALLEQALALPPRGGQSWLGLLRGQLLSADPALALEALEAAAVAQIPMRQAVLDRVLAQPEDELAWSLTQRLRHDEEVMAVLVPLAHQALQERKAQEDSLCSPASQAGCSSCSGKPGAADDALMVPKALEARLQPLLMACAQLPGLHQEFMEDCLIAPSAALRSVAAAALQRWPKGAIGDGLWQAAEALSDDSHPQVQAQIRALLAQGR